MYIKKDLRLKASIALNENAFKEHVAKMFGLKLTDEIYIRAVKRAIDARSKQVYVNVTVECGLVSEIEELCTYQKDYQDVKNAPAVIVVGAGPAGLFAGIRLIEKGLKPIIIERGKDVRSRRRDLAAINKQQIVNPDSNYCFGEGGAGTYSDGKLYTRSKKRGDVRRVLETLVAHGATSKILVDTHPHIGTNKLPKVVQNLRESIINAGGEVVFDERVIDFILKGDAIVGVKTNKNAQYDGIATILATGHSARDIFRLLDQKKIEIEAKPFALGVRVEHPQEIIDNIQYKLNRSRPTYLPAAPYSLTQQCFVDKDQRGVFSFCMCPGGFIVPSATEEGEVVVNGMSPSRRDSKYANSGIVVSIAEEDWAKYSAKFGNLAAMEYQATIERKAFELGGGGQIAPAQRLQDFVSNKLSPQLNKTSYIPGLNSAQLSEVLPNNIYQYLSRGFASFGKKMRGFMTNEAQVVGVESRTSSPVRIPRDRESLEHVTIKNLYPSGEGAGYAGGIVSAAVDGQRCVDAILSKYLQVK